MKKFIGSLLLVGASILNLGAQNTVGVCGSSTADQKLYIPRLEQNLQTLTQQGVTERGTVKYVPVHFHRVGNTAGTGKVREVRVLEQLCTMNEDYASLDIQFYLSPHPTLGLMDNSMNNDNVYSNQNNTWLMNNKKHTKALNIYVTNEAASGNTPLPGVTVLAYYSPVQDWVVSRKDQVNGNGNGTLSHEVGHFFSLPHTFFGWESDPFDSADPGWPVAPLTSPGGTPTEKQNGSNGTTAGDRIADTPPDYNFGILSSGCGPYNGGAQDPTGTLVDPMENNYMGYFSGCAYQFTPNQGEVMLEDLNTVQRNYLDNTFTPLATTITSPADLLVGPINNEIAANFDAVTLQWNEVTGATYYLLEIDQTASYSTSEYQSFIVQSNSKFLDNLKKNKQYYWRIKPFNEYYTCAEAKSGSFKTPLSSVSVKEIATIQSWKIQPNPVSISENAQLFLQSNKGFEGKLQIFDAAGKLVFEGNKRMFSEGESYTDLPTQFLQNGVYFVSITTGDARLTQRLVVLN